MKYKPHHVALTVRNTDESILWYKEKLGFQVAHRYHKHGMEITHLELDTVRLELFCYGNETKPLPTYREDLFDDLHVIGTKHLSIQVEDIESLTKNMKEKGVVFTQEIDTAGIGGKYTFFKDCNGILIELFEV